MLRSGRLSLGPTIDRFEELFAERVGAPYAAAVSSGTAGLHLLARIAGLGPGDEVITSPYSFVASANCFIFEGATPGLRRRRPADAQPRPGRGRGRDHAADEGDRRGRHLRLPLRARRAARDLRPARAGADRGRLRGARRRVQGPPVGSHGPPAVFAFYPNKQITTGEGGIVDDALRGGVAAAPSLRNQGRADAGGWLDHARLGFNYRLDDIQRRDRDRASWRSSTTMLELRRGRGGPLRASCSTDVEGSSRSARRRRRPPPLLVRLRRRARRGHRPRARDRRARAPRASQTRARTCPAIHLQQYMRERYGFARGHVPGRRGASRGGRSRSVLPGDRRPTTRSASSTPLRAALV